MRAMIVGQYGSDGSQGDRGKYQATSGINPLATRKTDPFG
jgi:hypothetical protein